MSPSPIACERAWREILKRAKTLPTKRVALAESLHLTLAESVKAPHPVPPFTNSAMDGYAVKASDVAEVPARLRVVTTIAAGDHYSKTLQRGEAARIMTGAALPKGADTIVRQEDTRADEDWVEILASKAKGEAVREAGSDLRAGRIAMKRGTRLGPEEMSTLAMLGLARVPVVRRLRVALLASGSELKPPGTKLKPGEIYESSSHALAETLRAEGIDVEFLGVARDERTETRRMIRAGLKFDMLLTAGGVSVGEFDYVKDEMLRAGVEEVFWRVAQRPGKPLFVGQRGKALVMGLPGNPVSSLVSLHLYALPALRKLMGRAEVFPPLMRFPAVTAMKKPVSLRTFNRVQFVWHHHQIGVALTRTDQRSGVFTSMLRCHALTNLPPGMGEVKVGDEIECFVIDPTALVRVMAER